MSDDEIRAPRLEYPIDLELVEAHVDAKGVDWDGKLEGRLRAERSGDRVRLNLSQWDREDHEVSATAKLSPDAAQELGVGLLDRGTGAVTHDHADGWVTMGWVDFRGYEDESDTSATVTVDTLQGRAPVVLSIRYQSSGGMITTKAPLDDEQVATLASWLAYAAAKAEAYEPQEQSRSGSDDQGVSGSESQSPIVRAARTLIPAGATLAFAMWVTNRAFSTADLTINGEPIGPMSGVEMAGFAVVILIMALAIHLFLISPERWGGRGA